MLGSEASSTLMTPGTGNLMGLIDGTVSVGLDVADNVYGLVTGKAPPTVITPANTAGVIAQAKTQSIVTFILVAVVAYVLLRRG